MAQRCRTQFTCFFDDADTVFSQSPLLGLYHSSTTTVATLFLFLLAMLLLNYLVAHMPGKLCASYHANITAQHCRLGVWMDPQQCAVANLKLIVSKLCSACRTFEWFYPCENLKQTAMCATWSLSSLPFAISHAPIDYRLFYEHSDSSFQWLLATWTEKFLCSLIVSSKACSLSVTLSLTHVATDLFALSCNGAHYDCNCIIQVVHL
jgi:hypothetical protein